MTGQQLLIAALTTALLVALAFIALDARNGLGGCCVPSHSQGVIAC